MRIPSFLAWMSCACVPLLAAAQPQTRDTSLFEFRVSDSLTLRAHGDTVWSLTPDRTTRIVDSVGHIAMRREKSGVVENSRWIVKGLTAYRADSSSGSPSVPAIVFQTYFKQIESARRFSKVTKGLPPV